MSNIRTARIMRGMSQVELARKMGILPQALNRCEAGERLGPKLLPLAAQALDVSPSWLAEMPMSIPVVDFISHDTLCYPVIAETELPGYGMLYIVDTEAGPVSVILAGGVQFTLNDWQGAQVLCAEEIAKPKNGYWVDVRGYPAIMLDGLPRILA